MSNPLFHPKWVDLTLVTGNDTGLVIKDTTINIIAISDAFPTIFAVDDLSELRDSLGFGTIVGSDLTNLALVDHIHSGDYEELDNTILKTSDIALDWINDPTKVIASSLVRQLNYSLNYF